jgi:cytochrome P450
MSIVKVSFSDFQLNHASHLKTCRSSGDLLELDYPGDGLNMYIVANHAGANEVLKNESGAFVHFAEYFGAMESNSAADKRIGEIFSKNLGNNSGVHRELRKDIRNHFNGSGVDQHNPFIQRTVEELAARLALIAQDNDGVVDLVKDFSMPLTFLVTSHVIGLEFEDEADRARCSELASEAIRLINLIAPEQDKLKALRAHDEFADFLLPQLQKFATAPEETLRKDCLLYDMGSILRDGHEDKLENFMELVNGLFQAGIGATGNFLALCLHLLLTGDEYNTPDDVRHYFLSPERTPEDKNEAIGEYIRITQRKLGGIFPRYSPNGGTLLGETIKPNSLVYMSLVSANLDEKAFKNPMQVNPDRIKIPTDLKPAQLRERREKRLEKSLSFSYGEHMCPGRRIALVIIRFAVDELFRQFPNMAVEELNVVSEMFGKPSEVTSFLLRLNNEVEADSAASA